MSKAAERANWPDHPIIERVAKALWLAEVEESDVARERHFDRLHREAEWEEDVKDPENGFYRPIYTNLLARAWDAVKAMREPTDTMIHQGEFNYDADGLESPIAHSWRAMIDDVTK